MFLLHIKSVTSHRRAVTHSDYPIRVEGLTLKRWDSALLVRNCFRLLAGAAILVSELASGSKRSRPLKAVVVKTRNPGASLRHHSNRSLVRIQIYQHQECRNGRTTSTRRSLLSRQSAMMVSTYLSCWICPVRTPRSVKFSTKRARPLAKEIIK